MRTLDRLLIAWANAPEHPAKQRLLRHALQLLGRRTEISLEFGRFYVHPGELIQRQLFLHGQFEPKTLQLVRFLLKEGGCFVDVGANIGVHSIAAATAMGPLGHVVAIEPNPSVCAELLENRRLNNCESRMTVVNAGVGSGRRLAPFGISCLGNNGTCHEVDSAFRDSFYVSTLPLVEICLSLNIDNIRLLKVDVEGAENDVFEGVLEHSGLRPEHIVFEYLPDFFTYGGDALGMLERLVEHGYELATVEGTPLGDCRAIVEGNIWAKLLTGRPT